jgi:uncharacterized damage-inducible protein DinB
MISKPNATEAPAYYYKYFELVQETDLMEALKNSGEYSEKFFAAIPLEKENYRYAEGKWTVKEVIGHIIDTERIFGYRAMCFSRKDNTELPGFDEGLYAPNANAGNRSLEDMIEEYRAVRQASISLFKYLTEEMLSFHGKANKMEVNARSIGWMIVGHNMHHCKVIGERYLAN